MTVLNHLDIRHAQPDDAIHISALIGRVVHHFLIHPSGMGAEAFMQSISPKAIEEYLHRDDFSYIVATMPPDQDQPEQGRQVIGVAALRDDEHLYHLFVDPEWHRRGVAKQLWAYLQSHAMQESGYKGYFTVNSSVYAVPVYQALGFYVLSKVEHKNGIAFVPMRWSVERPEINILCD
jgi:GNAT superfamily N-acetyltransferase